MAREDDGGQAGDGRGTDPKRAGSGWIAAVRRLGRFLGRVGAAFLGDRCLLLASSLSYATVLSVVPFLALAFSVAKGLGLYQTQAVRDALLQLAAGREAVVDSVLTYVDRTNVQTLGVVGALFLLFTAVSLLETIEGTVNIIWNAPTRRGLLQKYAGFLALIIVCPMLVLAAVSLTGALQSQEFVQRLLDLRLLGGLFRAFLTVVPWLFIVTALFALYAFLPNAPVRLTSALVGAVSAGTLWQITQWLYIRYQFGAAGYNAVYGGFAQVPLLLVWLYVSWAIVLLGAEIAHAFQLRRTYAWELAAAGYSHSDRRKLAVLVLLHLTKSFQRQEIPTADEALARLFDAPLRLVDEILRLFAARRLVIRVEEGQDRETYMLARPPEQITLRDVVVCLDEQRDPAVTDVPFERAYPLAAAIHDAFLAPPPAADAETFLDLYERWGGELDRLVAEREAAASDSPPAPAR